MEVPYLVRLLQFDKSPGEQGLEMKLNTTKLAACNTPARSRLRRFQVTFLTIVTLWPPAARAEELLAKIDGSAIDGGFGFGLGHPGVAISRDTVIVGSQLRDVYGRAYVFEKDFGGADTWGEVAVLSAFGGTAGDLFGWSVAISGDTGIVAEHRKTGGASMYIFERNRGGPDKWGGVARLSPTPANGSAVDIYGDTAIVGSGYANQLGAAYVFDRNMGGTDQWGQVVVLTASDGVMGDPDGFGSRVAIHGDTVIVGTPDQQTVGGEGSGAAYIYERNHGGPENWGEMKKLTASDAEAGDLFGADVGIFGDTAIVGAYGNDDAGLYSGSAYIFQRNAGGPGNWGEVAKLTASDAAPDDAFGYAVAVSRNLAIIGAVNDGDSDPNNPDQSDGLGSVYVFARDAGGQNQWGELFKFADGNGALGDFFGATLEMDGNLVVVGAPGKGVAGSVFVFRIPEPPTLLLAVSVLGVLSGICFGASRVGGQVCDG